MDAMDAMDATVDLVDIHPRSAHHAATFNRFDTLAILEFPACPPSLDYNRIRIDVGPHGSHGLISVFDLQHSSPEQNRLSISPASHLDGPPSSTHRTLAVSGASHRACFAS
ncbi:hypothetical protein CIB48_g7587 [Xylaria polymorpha]|nr:hypothetical protein CIB48_g7587 [Xylaria polymorpha]